MTAMGSTLSCDPNKGSTSKTPKLHKHWLSFRSPGQLAHGDVADSISSPRLDKKDLLLNYKGLDQLTSPDEECDRFPESFKPQEFFKSCIKLVFRIQNCVSKKSGHRPGYLFGTILVCDGRSH